MIKPLQLAPGGGADAVLNVLLWKLPLPTGCHNSNEAARFIVAELDAAGVEGLRWSAARQEFFVHHRPSIFKTG